MDVKILVFHQETPEVTPAQGHVQQSTRQRIDFWTDPRRSEPESIRFKVDPVASSADRFAALDKI